MRGPWAARTGSAAGKKRRETAPRPDSGIFARKFIIAGRAVKTHVGGGPRSSRGVRTTARMLPTTLVGSWMFVVLFRKTINH